MSTIKLDNQVTLSLSVTDRAKSANWQESHLGFETLFSADDAGWTELSTHVAGLTISLGDAEILNRSSVLLPLLTGRETRGGTEKGRLITIFRFAKSLPQKVHSYAAFAFKQHLYQSNRLQ